MTNMNVGWEDVHLPIPRGIETICLLVPSVSHLQWTRVELRQIPPYYSPYGFHGDVFAGNWDNSRWNFDMNRSPPTTENIVKWLGDIQEKHHIQFKRVFSQNSPQYPKIRFEGTSRDLSCLYHECNVGEVRNRWICDFITEISPFSRIISSSGNERVLPFTRFSVLFG